MSATGDHAGDLKVEAAVGTTGGVQEWHPGLTGGAVAFSDIAAHTGTDHIFPSISTTTGSRHHMINGQIIASAGAILTGKPISMQNVAPS